MNNFKIGDVLVGNEDNRPNNIVGGLLYTVKAVDTENCIHYVRVTNHTGGWVRSSRFSLHKEAEAISVALDDELPPAPGSVRYNDEYTDRTAYKQTWLDVKRCTRRIYLESGQYGTGHGVGMEITPDAALQLAHDLTRMAMEIKRKEKNND